MRGLGRKVSGWSIRERQMARNHRLRKDAMEMNENSPELSRIRDFNWVPMKEMRRRVHHEVNSSGLASRFGPSHRCNVAAD
jgi:hypothetical protein